MPLQCLSLLLLALAYCHAVRDANAPWGDNPPRRFDMYWREPGNVLEDLEEFSELYVRSVGCIWSEYGYDNYDDDGENRDGDENWYQGRTTSFRANAAYSLYGVKRGSFALRKCSRFTYINTFITNMGSDLILNATGRLNSGYDDDTGYGHSYCYEVDQDEGNRDLGSGDNGDDNAVSTTMGCSLEGDRYVMATFQGSYCDGRNFLNITEEMKDYNRAIKTVRCEKIWDYSTAFSSGVRVDTAADYLLEYSSACSNYMYEGRCPDPYGVEKAYRKAVTRRSGAALRGAMRVMSWMALSVGLALIVVGYCAKNSKRIRKRASRVYKRFKRTRGDVYDETGGKEKIRASLKSRRRKSGKKKKKKKQDFSAGETLEDEQDTVVSQQSPSYVEMDDFSTDATRQPSEFQDDTVEPTRPKKKLWRKIRASHRTTSPPSTGEIV